MPEQEIGVVTHYFGHIGVAAIQLTQGGLKVGDTVHIKGHTSDLLVPIESMQLEHESVAVAAKGQGVGIKVPSKVHEHDKVYVVTP